MDLTKLKKYVALYNETKSERMSTLIFAHYGLSGVCQTKDTNLIINIAFKFATSEDLTQEYIRPFVLDYSKYLLEMYESNPEVLDKILTLIKAMHIIERQDDNVDYASEIQSIFMSAWRTTVDHYKQKKDSVYRKLNVFDVNEAIDKIVGEPDSDVYSVITRFEDFDISDLIICRTSARLIADYITDTYTDGHHFYHDAIDRFALCADKFIEYLDPLMSSEDVHHNDDKYTSEAMMEKILIGRRILGKGEREWEEIVKLCSDNDFTPLEDYDNRDYALMQCGVFNKFIGNLLDSLFCSGSNRYEAPCEGFGILMTKILENGWYYLYDEILSDMATERDSLLYMEFSMFIDKELSDGEVEVYRTREKVNLSHLESLAESRVLGNELILSLLYEEGERFIDLILKEDLLKELYKINRLISMHKLQLEEEEVNIEELL